MGQPHCALWANTQTGQHGSSRSVRNDGSKTAALKTRGLTYQTIHFSTTRVYSVLSFVSRWCGRCGRAMYRFVPLCVILTDSASIAMYCYVFTRYCNVFAMYCYVFTTYCNVFAMYCYVFATYRYVFAMYCYVFATYCYVFAMYCHVLLCIAMYCYVFDTYCYVFARYCNVFTMYCYVFATYCHVFAMYCPGSLGIVTYHHRIVM